MRRVVPLLAVLFVACVPAPRAPVDLERVEPRAIRFGLASPRAVVCPGQPVKLDVVIDAVDDEGDPLKLVPHRRTFEDTIFDVRQLRVSSPQGFFDGDGTFYPDPDVTASVHTGFVLYARAPHGPTFSVRFPPSYECTRAIGRDGSHGDPAGGRGAKGPKFSVFVTWVRTPDYDKLLAARAVGEIDALTLVAPGTPLVARARGGRGGAGAPGHDGGDGGDGGDVIVVLDDRFDDLDRMVTGDVGGGDGGPGGYDELGARIDPEGTRGREGRRGAPGTFTVARGADVRARFERLGAIVPY